MFSIILIRLENTQRIIIKKEIKVVRWCPTNCLNKIGETGEGRFGRDNKILSPSSEILKRFYMYIAVPEEHQK